MDRNRAASHLSCCLRAAGDFAGVAQLEADYAAVAGAAWARVWPSVLDAMIAKLESGFGLVTADTVAELVPVGREALREWPSRSEVDALVAVAADAFSAGKLEVETAVTRSGRPARAHEVVRNPAKDMDPKGLLATAVPHLVDELPDFAVTFAELAPDAFTVPDTNAARWLGRDSVYWVGNAYDEGLGAEIANVGSRVLAEGGTRVEAGALLRAALDARFSRPDMYWQVVGSATMNRARGMGSTSGFVAAGVASYRIVSILDERTSEICLEMNGRVFDVEYAVDLRDRMLGAETPDDVRDVKPWLSLDEIKDLGSRPSAEAALAAEGQSMPPYHGLCRTTVEALAYL